MHNSVSIAVALMEPVAIVCTTTRILPDGCKAGNFRIGKSKVKVFHPI
jgi:hypothetical protein